MSSTARAANRRRKSGADALMLVTRGARRRWSWSPLALAAVYAATLLLTLRSVVDSIYLDSDKVSALFIGQLYGHAPAGVHVVLGDTPWYTALWFESLTRGFPDHRVLWELAPWLFTLVGIALVTWATIASADRWAGMIVAVTLGCAGSNLLPLQFAWSIHAMAYVHVCFLAAFVVLLARDSALIGSRRWVHLTVLTGVALITAAGIASDVLVAVAGLVPLIVAGAALAWLSPAPVAKRVVGSVVGVAVASGLFARLIDVVMKADHVVPFRFGIAFSPFNRLLDHVGLLIQSIAVLMNGDFGGAGLSVSSILAFTCAAAIAVGAYATIRSGRTLARRLLSTPRATVSSRRDLARVAYLSFWISSALVVSAAFVFSTVPVDIENKRYVVTVAYAMVAVVAVAAASRTWARVVVTAGCCAIAAASALAMHDRDIQRSMVKQPNGTVAAQLVRWARSQDLVYGYAGYWDAAPLTWQMHAGAQIFPVSACYGNRYVCPFNLSGISTWYRPRVGVRTFFVVDALQAAVNGIAGPMASLGKPVAVKRIQELTAYVYPYDIASRFRPNPSQCTGVCS
jgi:hypothetical protein